MKNKLVILSLAVVTLGLTACNGLPKCYDELDECDRGGAYTEERTAQADKRVKVAPVVIEEPAPTPIAVVEEPTPEPTPVVIDDAPIMQSAEPQFVQISK